MNTEGISTTGSLVDLAVNYGLIIKSGAFFKIGDQNIQGREGAKKYLKDNPKIVKDLEKQIWQKVRSQTEGDSQNSKDSSQSEE
jgi:recombination protein RecA